MAIACGGTGGGAASPTGPSQAMMTLSMDPNPLVERVCGADFCPNSAGRVFLTNGMLTVRETGGIAGRVDSIRARLRRDSDSSVTAEFTFDAAAVSSHSTTGSNQFGGRGALTTEIGLVYDLALGQQAATMVFDVAVTDDRGNRTSQSLSVPVRQSP